MQEKHLFEYAVLRVVPCVEREEFLNVGVILYCPAQRFLKTTFHLNQDRLRSFNCDLDLTELYERLEAFERVCAGGKNGGTIGQLPLASRFRWLTATRSTVVQTSAVHPGLCTDAQETLQRLHTQLVL
ncbi:DUF3037 domain-containing protein [Sabulibacter ruber]|uniref:DUF3037 domain-containing protein n=1 Tax=Sabulibacter ruber TaxID=2811901 RepID=UPI001A978670|nr:DUF3037 domain-containing protein [Sabulibacter ruber]